MALEPPAPARGQQHRVQRRPRARRSPRAAPGCPRARRSERPAHRAPRCVANRGRAGDDAGRRRLDDTSAGRAPESQRTAHPDRAAACGPAPRGPLEGQHLDEAVRQQPVVLEIGQEGEHGLRDAATTRSAAMRVASALTARAAAPRAPPPRRPPSRTSASRVVGSRALRDDRDRARRARRVTLRQPGDRIHLERGADAQQQVRAARTARGPPPSPARAASRRTARRRASPARRIAQRATPSLVEQRRHAPRAG